MNNLFAENAFSDDFMSGYQYCADGEPLPTQPTMEMIDGYSTRYAIEQSVTIASELREHIK